MFKFVQAAVAAMFLFASATANATTLGDAFQLTDNIKDATKQRCPQGKQSDIQSLTAALRCQSINMAAGAFGIKLGQLANRLMQECIDDMKAGKSSKDCKATNDNYEAVVLTGDEETAYVGLKTRYDALLRDFPVLRP